MKKILSRAAVKRVDAATIGATGITSDALMERAAQAFADVFLEKIYERGNVVFICGPGNNGSDGLAAARLLRSRGVSTSVFCLPSNQHSDDFNINMQRLRETDVNVTEIQRASDLPTFDDETILVDALYGTGLNKPLMEPAAGIVQRMNAHRGIHVSIDVPSGMMEAPHAVADTMVYADHVVTFQIPRLGLLLPRNGYNPYTLTFADIGLDQRFIDEEISTNFLLEASDLKKIIRKRRLFDGKWTYGHALIVAGSSKAMGAALLATGACLRSGCGLVTTHTARSGGSALNTALPETMFSPDQHDEMITDVTLHPKFSAVGIGCGIGTASETAMAMVDVLTKTKLPCVLDADALTLLAQQHAWRELVPAGSILTPHVKEFDRLAGEQANDYERMQEQLVMAQQLNSVVVVKGAYTRIALPDGICYFNSTGTPALASAGSGDVLTGLLTGLLARGYNAVEAAMLGVYLHGLAAQLAVSETDIESFKATDIINHLPQAFHSLYS